MRRTSRKWSADKAASTFTTWIKSKSQLWFRIGMELQFCHRPRRHLPLMPPTMPLLLAHKCKIIITTRAEVTLVDVVLVPRSRGIRSVSCRGSLWCKYSPRRSPRWATRPPRLRIRSSDANKVPKVPRKWPRQYKNYIITPNKTRLRIQLLSWAQAEIQLIAW